MAITCLALFCELAVRGDRPEVRLGDFYREGGDISRGLRDIPRLLAHLAGGDGLLRLRREAAGETALAGIPSPEESAGWIIEPLPEVWAALPAVCERVRVYARLAARMGEPSRFAGRKDPPRRAMAEAVLCFNAGLFFETHEHLERVWAAMPKGPAKRFLQGIIQISVGFHHAQAGKYDGAINQLGKGLEKTLGASGAPWGLDCEAFLPGVAAAREAIVQRGRANMRPLSLAEIPRMPIRGA